MSALLALAIQVAAQPTSQTRKMTRARLNAIAGACDAPREWLKLRGKEVVFRASPDEDQAKIACVLQTLDAALDEINGGAVDDTEDSKEK